MLIDRDQAPKGLLGLGERKTLQTDRVTGAEAQTQRGRPA